MENEVAISGEVTFIVCDLIDGEGRGGQGQGLIWQNGVHLTDDFADEVVVGLEGLACFTWGEASTVHGVVGVVQLTGEDFEVGPALLCLAVVRSKWGSTLPWRDLAIEAANRARGLRSTSSTFMASTDCQPFFFPLAGDGFSWLRLS